MGKEIGEVSKETEVDYKIASEDVKGVKIDDNRVDKDGNKVAVDKVKPPAPKLDEEAALKLIKQKKKHSSEVDRDRLGIDLIDWNDPKDVPKNLCNFEAGSLEQPSLLRLVPIGLLTGSVDNEEAVKGEKSKTESNVTESVNDGKLSELIEIVSSHGYS